MTRRKEYITETHNQIIGWTENCDTKASIVLAFVGVLMSIAFTSEYLLEEIETQIQSIIIYWREGIGTFDLLSTMMFVTLIGFVTLMGLCCYYAIASLKANLNCPGDSKIFFGKIAETPKEEYLEKVDIMSDEELESDKLSQIYICAKICNEKFKCYNKSMKYLSFGLLLFVCFIVFILILKAV